MKIKLNVSGIHQILTRICITLNNPKDPEAWHGNPKHCHTAVTQYLSAHNKSSDNIILLGSNASGKVMHSIVVDKNGNIVKDSYDDSKVFARTEYDHKTGNYRFTIYDQPHRYSRMFSISRVELSEYCRMVQ